MHIIADGNNIAWAGFHSMRKATGAESREEFVRSALLGLTQSIVGLVVRAGEPPDEPGRSGPARHRISGLTVVFDDGRPLRRRTLFPAYQTGREGDPNFMDNERYVLDGVDQFVEAAHSLPLAILRGVNTEADDLVAAFTESHEGPVRIASTDRDFLQLIDERVSIYSPVKRLVITTENFSDATAPRDSNGTATAFPRERYLDYRVASGDASDNLPGIPGVGALTAAKLVAVAPIDAYVHDRRLLSNTLGRRNVKVEGAFASGEAAAVIERNRTLMDLRLAALGYPSLENYERRFTWNETEFRAWVRSQRIAALDLDSACSAFERISSGQSAVSQVRQGALDLA
jgi:5'-3' exonuclease